MGNSFTGAPALIIEISLDLGLLKSLTGPGDPRKTVDDTQINNQDDDDDDHEQLINIHTLDCLALQILKETNMLRMITNGDNNDNDNDQYIDENINIEIPCCS